VNITAKNLQKYVNLLLAFVSIGQYK